MFVFRIYSGTNLVLSSSQQVIIGSNGSGKSTILKLVARIYDPTEGTILIDGQDIKTLRLVDLRRAMTILFQDYTHFPLSVSPTPYLPLILTLQHV
jgi:ABC-type multidrug transport system fused ATPase/permease subunit